MTIISGVVSRIRGVWPVDRDQLALARENRADRHRSDQAPLHRVDNAPYMAIPRFRASQASCRFGPKEGYHIVPIVGVRSRTPICYPDINNTWLAAHDGSIGEAAISGLPNPDIGTFVAEGCRRIRFRSIVRYVVPYVQV